VYEYTYLMSGQKKNTKKGSKKSSRMKRVGVVSLSLILLLSLYCGWQIWEIRRYGYSDNGQPADCGIVLGAAAWHNKPSPVFKARIDHAVKLLQQGRIKKIIFTGGKGKGAEFGEAEVAYNYCINHHRINKKYLYLENLSLTTSANLRNAQAVMKDENLHSAIIISDAWHLKRAHLIAESIDLSHSVSATHTSEFKSKRAKWKFLIREFYNIQVFKVFGDLSE